MACESSGSGGAPLGLQTSLQRRQPRGLAHAGRLVLLVIAASIVALRLGAGVVAGQPAIHNVVTQRPVDLPRTINAVFVARSFAPGAVADLKITAPIRRITIQIFHSGLERTRTHSPSEMLGVACSGIFTITLASSGDTVWSLHIGNWQSGLYFARLSGPGGWLGFAPLIVRPKRLGEHRTAIVLPTNTWAAYNFRDVDDNGVGDTWYADPSIHTVDLDRPFLNRGVPPHFTDYDLGFIRWVAHEHYNVDYLSDDDLENVQSGEALARSYDLIIFSGHEEYATLHSYNIVERYKDLGGHLAFLSANNFFYRVERDGQLLRGRTRWRDSNRPEAALVGAMYVDWNHDQFPNKPYVVVGEQRARWLFQGTGLRNGSMFGRYGIEIDARAATSPKGTMVLARIPNVFGRGKTAEMTYYDTAAGAEVFDAGSINFGGTAEFPVVSRLLANLWKHLDQPLKRTSLKA